MLQAILRRKARLNAVYEETNSQADVMRLKEDTLTAMVFGRLVYLPSDVLWNLIRSAALPKGELPNRVGAIGDVQFWPEWKLDRSLKVEKTRVEPDLLIRFSDIDVIVEAKRWDEDQMQYYQQLFYEWLAWSHLEPQSGRQFIVLAVGGVGDLTEEKAVALRKSVHGLVPISSAAKKPLVFAFSWDSLLMKLISLQENLSDAQTQNASNLRVINDVIAALDLHNFYPRYWLSELYSVADRFLLRLEEKSLDCFESVESVEMGFTSLRLLFLFRPVSDESIRIMNMEAK